MTGCAAPCPPLQARLRFAGFDSSARSYSRTLSNGQRMGSFSRHIHRFVITLSRHDLSCLVNLGHAVNRSDASAGRAVQLRLDGWRVKLVRVAIAPNEVGAMVEAKAPQKVGAARSRFDSPFVIAGMPGCSGWLMAHALQPITLTHHTCTKGNKCTYDGFHWNPSAPSQNTIHCSLLAARVRWQPGPQGFRLQASHSPHHNTA